MFCIVAFYTVSATEIETYRPGTGKNVNQKMMQNHEKMMKNLHFSRWFHTVHRRGTQKNVPPVPPVQWPRKCKCGTEIETVLVIIL